MSPPKFKDEKEYRWFCCYCRSSWNSQRFDVQCVDPYCGHKRCGTCTVEEIPSRNQVKDSNATGSCELCGESFEQEGDLRQHKMTVHAPKHESKVDKLKKRFKELDSLSHKLDKRYTKDQVPEPESTNDGPVSSPPKHREIWKEITSSFGPVSRKEERRIHTSQGDSVLIRAMKPNRPDAAQSVGNGEVDSDTKGNNMGEKIQNRESTTAYAAADHPVVRSAQPVNWPDNHQVAVQVDDRDEGIALEDHNTGTGSNFSSSYSYPLFSMPSPETSATDRSKSSGYSTKQIATATRELMMIFCTDEMLVPLYLGALENPNIGEKNLERNLRRLFKSYARALEEEASDMLEHAASQLVAAKSRYLARSIMEKFEPHEFLPPMEIESSDEDGHAKTSKEPINENAFEDLAVFRDFLIGSQAFQSLRHQIASFARPSTGAAQNCNTSPYEVQEPSGRAAESTNSLSQIRIFPNTVIYQLPARAWTLFKTGSRYIGTWSVAATMILRDVYIATGQLEPPHQPGQTRLRWTCKCGEKIFGDVTVLEPEGLELLKAQMKRSSGIRFEPDGVRSVDSGQPHISRRPFSWVQRGIGKFFGSFWQSSQQTLPTSTPFPSVEMQGSPGSSMSNQILYILACIPQGRRIRILRQEQIESVATDRQLFQFLKQRYVEHRGRVNTILTLKSIQGIFFVKFLLPMGERVDIRPHDKHCKSSACECLPPEAIVEPAPQAEYRCRPIPPKLLPPVTPEFLAHHFAKPECFNEQSTWILDQLPKRTCGRLSGKIGEPAEGWGIYYQESWDGDKIILICFVVFLLGSLTFGVLWSILKMDVQGAFGVAAYIVTFCAILLAFVSTRESM